MSRTVKMVAEVMGILLNNQATSLKNLTPKIRRYHARRSQSGDSAERLFRSDQRTWAKLRRRRRRRRRRRKVGDAQVFPFLNGICPLRALDHYKMLWLRCVRHAVTPSGRGAQSALSRLARAQSTSSGSYEYILVSNPVPGVG